MKAILEFNLPEDQEEFRRAAKASDLCHVLYEIKEYLFRLSDSEQTTLNEPEAILNYLKDLMYDSGINLDELWT